MEEKAMTHEKGTGDARTIEGRDGPITVRPGDIVLVSWPGARGGSDCKIARIVRVNQDGTRVTTRVALTTRNGRYTGAFASSLRYFESRKVLCHAAT